MKKYFTLVLAAGALILAGCSSTIRTLELKDGRLTMTEERHGSSPQTWEVKEVTGTAEIITLRKAGWKSAGVLQHEGGPDTFLMKRKLILQAAAPPPPFHPMFITALGTNSSADGSWRIGVSEASLDFTRCMVSADEKGMAMSKYSSTITVPPPVGQTVGWTTHKGWFAFIENESRVWAYDGDRLLVLWTEIVTGNNSSGAIYFNGYPCAVPAEVFSRLSERAQQTIERHQ